MNKEISNLLTRIDNNILLFDSPELMKEFQNIPLEVFGQIQIDRPKEFPNILKWLPVMPSEDIQDSWTGSANHDLLKQSINFIKIAITTYHSLTCRSLSQGNVLDFGCGWGRLIRLLYKYVPSEKIYGVDPWDQSIQICRDTKLQGNFSISDYLPRNLPTPENIKFDFIMAFSVFTHLSEKSALISANTLKNYLTDDGVIAITIRPVEYWGRISHNNDISRHEIDKLLYDHNNKGFAFRPHNRAKIEGDITYGDTSMTLDYIKNNFNGLDIVGIEWSEIDSLQIIVFLMKSQKTE